MTCVGSTFEQEVYIVLLIGHACILLLNQTGGLVIGVRNGGKTDKENSC
jgi:hypothetical protein